jgi:hypothetical protein
MKLGIIGLPNSGKTTIFSALTRTEHETTSYSDAKAEPHVGIVDVEDERIDTLSGMYNPKKTVYATLDIVDFAGMAPGSGREGLFTPQALQLLKTSDALAGVLRNFSDPEIDAVSGPPDPLRDAEALTDELILADLILTERRLETIEKDFSRGKKTPQAEKEKKILSRIEEILNENRPVRELELSEDDLKTVSHFQFLTLKPILFILNSSEETFGTAADIAAKLPGTVEFAGKFEMELGLLEDSEEAAVFMEDMGIAESARRRLAQACYSLLGYISFFTVGEDEVRAWTVKKDAPAVEAAGAIHSDLQRGFIRAECFSYGDLVEAGSEKGVKEAGKFRLEGKDYTVRDGDILHIRFSV